MRILLAFLAALALSAPALADAPAGPLSRTSGGVSLGLADGRYLKLDASNGPLTGSLGINPASVACGTGSYVSFGAAGAVGNICSISGQLGFTSAGVGVLSLNSGAGILLSVGRYNAPNGTAGSPSFTFSSDTGTGMFRVGASDLGFSSGGTQRLDISTTLLTSTLPYVGPVAGSAASPSYTFAGNTNTGFSSTATNEAEVDINGSGEITWDSSGTHIARGHFDGGAPGSTAAVIGTSTCSTTSVSTCSDLRCKATGTCTATGQTIVVNFGTAYSGSGPNCVFSPLDANAAKDTMSISTSTTSVTLTAQAAAPAGAANFFIQCMQ